MRVDFYSLLFGLGWKTKMRSMVAVQVPFGDERINASRIRARMWSFIRVFTFEVITQAFLIHERRFTARMWASKTCHSGVLCRMLVQHLPR